MSSGGLSQAVKTIPYVKGLPVFGTSLYVLAKGWAKKYHEYVDLQHKKYGPIYKENMGPSKAVFVADPEIARKVFVLEGKYPKHFNVEPWTYYNEKYSKKRGIFFMEDEEWHHHRRIMNKHLLKEDITKNLASTYDFVVDKLISRLKEQSDSGQCINNLQLELYRHSLSSVLATVVGSSYVNHIDRVEKDFDFLAGTFCKVFEATSEVRISPKIAELLRLPAWKRFVTSVTASLTLSESVLDRMEDICTDDGLLVKMKNANVDMASLKAIVCDLILAAGDTTAYTMQWALYNLGKSRELQDRVGNDDVLIRGAIREALRLHSPAIFVTRGIGEAGEASGYHLDAGEMVLISLYTMGHSTEIYKNPEEFWPERWIRTKSGYQGVYKPQAFIPFAMGSRSCVGRKVAEVTMALSMKKILSTFYLDTMNDVDMVMKLIPVPSEPIQIKLSSK